VARLRFRLRLCHLYCTDNTHSNTLQSTTVACECIYTHTYLWSWGTEPRDLLCVCSSEQPVWEM